MNYKQLQNVFDYAADQAKTSDIEVLDGISCEEQVTTIKHCQEDLYEMICMSLLFNYDYYLTNKEVLDDSKIQELQWLFKQNKEVLEYSFYKFIETYEIKPQRNINWTWIHNVSYEQACLFIKLFDMLDWEHRGLYHNDDDTYSVRYRQ